jgi:homoserine kinase
MRNEVPLGRGLGSSAAAIAAGLLASAVLLDVEHEPQSLLPSALPLEGHPDNIVAALWGGCTIGALVGGGAVVHRIMAPDRLHAVVLVPNAFSSTFESRAMLPTEVPRADAVFNASRVGLFVAALTEDRLDLLRVAMEDRLHQPYRGESFRYLQPTIAAAIQAGAHGAALSGAGTSVIALASHNFEAIAQAMSGAASDHNISARTLILPPDFAGATYEWRS